MLINKITSQRTNEHKSNGAMKAPSFSGNIEFLRVEPSSQWGNSIRVADYYYKYIPDIKEKAADMIASIQKHLEDFKSGKKAVPEKDTAGPESDDLIIAHIEINKNHPDANIKNELKNLASDYKVTIRDYMPKESVPKKN